MSESEKVAETAEEETVQLVFYVGESDEVDFTVDIPKSQFDFLAADAEKRGITLDDLLVQIITDKLKMDLGPAEEVVKDKE